MQKPSLFRLNDSEASRILVRRVVEESFTKLKETPASSERTIRWELGSCWVQHLQKQEASVDDSSKRTPEEIITEPDVKGLGQNIKLLKKREKKESIVCSSDEKEENKNAVEIGEVKSNESNCEADLKKLISEEAFFRLRESRTNLHLKVSVTTV